ncbi:MAG: hypothetical protein K2Y56_24840 [Methylobacterium sp.]|uniref:hypothetical protein n=1 Tax=Methylobacterium sp. TaxID=409 RepID=UPI0025F3AFE3|nr:hypothetical protein [Methylobacterium sp.]MBX9934701.1 hypothetical protein [Methylobacterium sp.]
MPRHGRGIAAAFARARAGDRRLAPWMARHHDELLRELGAGRVEWTPALVVFDKLCLTDEYGRPLTRDTASRTWRRVRAAVAAARQAEAREAARPGELVRGVRLVAAPAPHAVRPTPSPPTASAMAPPAGTVEEATERIQSVLAAMGAARVPLPPQPSRITPAADARPALDRTRR